MGVAWTFS